MGFCPANAPMLAYLSEAGRTRSWQEIELNLNATQHDRYLVAVWWRINREASARWLVEPFRRGPLLLGPDALRLERAMTQPDMQAVVWLFNEQWLLRCERDFKEGAAYEVSGLVKPG